VSLLGVQELVVGYGGAPVVRGVSLFVKEREIVALIGPNGAGKSTLLKAIFGLLTPEAGRVLFQGQDITGLPPELLVRRGLAYMPQARNVFPSLTVDENLQMGGYLLQRGVRERMEQLYALFPQLAARRHLRASKLSGGERQMLALARALMLDPVLLLLDEPSAALAPAMVDAVFDRIRAINQAGVAILMVEQNAVAALRLAHRGYVLAAGRNQLEGTGAELLANEAVGRLYLGVAEPAGASESAG
jgi:ABC-type branched-subunit amino acid transport system ATPase component